VAVLYNGAFICKSAVPHYADNGDGTVTDNTTGLMWEKKTGTFGRQPPNPDVHDVSYIYTWSAASPFTDPSGTLFTTFLATLNGGDYYNPTDMMDENANPGTCFANHCDWRIPTVVELQSILLAPLPCTSPCVDPTFGPTGSVYWSSSSLAGGPNGAWGVDFFSDFHATLHKEVAFSARAVRGGR